MEAQELKTTVSGLRTLGKNVSELSSLKRELISEAEYIKKHHPAPEKKAVRHHFHLLYEVVENDTTWLSAPSPSHI